MEGLSLPGRRHPLRKPGLGEGVNVVGPHGVRLLLRHLSLLHQARKLLLHPLGMVEACEIQAFQRPVVGRSSGRPADRLLLLYEPGNIGDDLLFRVKQGVLVLFLRLPGLLQLRYAQLAPQGRLFLIGVDIGEPVFKRFRVLRIRSRKLLRMGENLFFLFQAHLPPHSLHRLFLRRQPSDGKGRLLRQGRRRQDPVQVRPCRGNSAKGQRISPSLGLEFFQLLLKASRASQQDQLLLCPGKRHVEDPQLLSQHLHIEGFLEHPLLKRGDLRPPPGVQPVHADAQIRVNHHPAPGILAVEALSQASHDHHREFQALALMDRHNAHRVLVLSQHARLAEILVIALQLLDVAHKMEQPPVAGLLERQRPLDEHPHVGLALAAARLGGQVVPVSGAVKKLLDQLVDRQKFCPPPVFPYASPKFPHTFPEIGIRPLRLVPQAALVKGPLRKGAPDPRQIHVREAANHGFEHRRQRNILAGIVHDPQKVEKGLNFYRSKISCP